MVPPASHKIARVSWYSGSWPSRVRGPLRGSHPLWRYVPVPSRPSLSDAASPTTPSSVARAWFGLIPVRSPLLRESRLISLRRATEMFQFTHVPSSCLCVQQAISRHHSGGVASFGILGFFACMQLPPNVSPVSASFIGLLRQGIHLVLCVACCCLLRGSLHIVFGVSALVLCFNSCLRVTRSAKLKEYTFQLSTCCCRVTPTTGEWKTGIALDSFLTPFLLDLEVDRTDLLAKIAICAP